MKGFRNVTAYIYDKGIVTTNVAISGEKIAYIGDDETMISEDLFDTSGLILVPAFIDQHIHGAGGSDVMDATPTALANISKALIKEGTALFLPTTMTMSEEQILKALKNNADCTNKDLGGARIIGTHLEGPFISEKYKGAQSKEFIVKPSIEKTAKYIDVSRETIKIISFSPENDPSGEFTRYLKNNNIIASAGHSNASYDDIETAVKNGLRQVTHTFNAQSPIHHRNIGVAGSALIFDELACEAICDTIHLSIPALKLLIKNKPKDKIILITDSIRAKWQEGDISELGGQKVYIKNNEARLEDGTLAGSVLKMNTAVKNMVVRLNIPFTEAINYATYNPAKSLGIESNYGTISTGKYACITALDREFNVVFTMVHGKLYKV